MGERTGGRLEEEDEGEWDRPVEVVGGVDTDTASS